MNKKLILGLILGIAVLVGSKVNATGSIYDGLNYTEVSLTSAVIFNGAGRVFKIYGSTDTAMMGAFCLLIDTPAVMKVNPSVPDAFATRIKSPAMYFVSTNTYSGVGMTGVPVAPNTYLLMDYGSEGLLISSGAFVWKGVEASGLARRVGVLWRK